MPDYYRILGVNPDCRFPELKKAYYRQALVCHPDRFAGSPAKAEAFKQLVEAFNVLSDPLARARYDARHFPHLHADHLTRDRSAEYLRHETSILDSFADDILEEMIVGNTIPQNTTLQTLMLDLERTERFCLFREGKTLFYEGRVPEAAALFQHYLVFAPMNILAHFFLGRCHVLQRRYRRAAREFREAIRIGSRRNPPLTLPRIRRELDTLRRTRLGPVTRFAAWWKNDPNLAPSLPPDEEMRREVARAMHNLIREDQRRSRQLPDRRG